MIAKVVAAVLLAAGAAVLVFALGVNDAANRDFISYWAAGRQLVQGRNPYDPGAVLELERGAGFAGDRPLIMRNPPVAAVLVLPLGVFGATTAAGLWSLAILASIMGSIHLLWLVEGKPEGRRHLLGYCFAPVMACLLAGQMGVVLLLGFSLFLYWERDSPLLAGCALSVCALKPHLFLPFAAVLALWTLRSARYRVLLGAALGMAMTLALALAFRPAILGDYASMLQTADIGGEFIPQFSTLIRMALDRDAVWLQFLPTIAGCLWAIWYWRRLPSSDWRRDGLLVLLVSVWVAPYAWFSDEAVLFPAMWHAIVSTDRRGASLLWFGVPAGLALGLVLWGATMPSGAYIWTPTAWLISYTRMMRARNNQGG